MHSAGLIAAIFAAQVVAGQQTGPATTGVAAVADTGSMHHTNDRVPPIAHAVRIATSTEGVRIDGRLDEAIWAQARPITDFLQTAPHEGEPATERADVRIVYDDQALYVGARLFDSDPGGIRAQLARRDATTEADLFEIAIDSYHDHNTAFVFGVNPSGVKTDRIVGSDGFSSNDGWDPVWSVVTRVDSVGWTVEMRIPLSQLRFSTAPRQVWGVNVFRRIQRKAETDVFAYSKPSDRGYASYFAHLVGVERIPASRRLELLPYATTRQERINPGALGNPFNNGARQVSGAGLDAKYGVTSGLTLDATINPDFGQVDADPAFINLTAFEQQLNERRPFFVEGADIFNFNTTAQLFYSRRIGRGPQGNADPRGGFVDQPDHATIAGAGKLSGRAGDWSIGALEATTARAVATVDSLGSRFHDEVEPLTNYFVARGRRDAHAGSDQLGFIMTAVNRSIDTPALDFLRSSAYVGGIDFGHRFSTNTYNLSGSLVASRIGGDTIAIQRTQRSSARYYQRPDARTNRYDPLATSLAGASGFLNLGKERGANQFGVNASFTSPGFEVNDAGFQTNADDISYTGFVNRRWTRPGRVFRFFFIGNNLRYSENFDRVKHGLAYNANSQGTFLNYWNFDAHFSNSWRVLSDKLTRGGPLASAPGFWHVSGGFGSDSRRMFSTYNGGFYSRNEIAGWGAGWFSSIDFRPTQAVTVSIQPGYNAQEGKLQFLKSQADAAIPATFGRRYLFASVKQHSLDLTTRLDVTFRPNLSLQFYTQPFVATADYRDFKQLLAASSMDYLHFGEAGSTLQCFDASDASVSCSATKIAYYLADPDGSGPAAAIRIGNNNFNSRSLNGNAVLRWEYRPGSTMFFVWSTNCAAGAVDPRFRATDDVRHLCQGPSNNVFAVKATYWVGK